MALSFPCKLNRQGNSAWPPLWAPGSESIMRSLIFQARHTNLNPRPNQPPFHGNLRHFQPLRNVQDKMSKARYP